MQQIKLNTSEFEEYSHRYHSYPAKFYPPLVKYLIQNYAVKNYPIADLFAGCGTTLLESKLEGFKSFGVDINPISQIITQAKLNPINPKVLENRTLLLLKSLKKNSIIKEINLYQDQILNFWFTKDNLKKAEFIKSKITNIKNKKTRNFFFCALSNCLKKASLATHKSPKLTKDNSKNPQDLFLLFQKQIDKMTQKNNLLYEKLNQEKKLYLSSNLKLKDARKSGILSESIGTIITSPPYATSYEYKNLHKLSNHFFFKVDKDMEYIGSSKIFPKKIRMNISLLAQKTVSNLNKQDPLKSIQVKNYFNQMFKVFQEAKRILIKKGVICLVVSDSRINSLKIPTKDIFKEMLLLLNFQIEEILLRKIEKKQIPVYRDGKTGQFTREKNNSLYGKEYIIIARKIV